MAFNIVVGGVVRHVMYCTIPGQVSVTKRDYQCVSITGGSNIDGQSVIEMFDNYHATSMKNCLAASATYYGSQLYYQTPVGLKPRPVYTKVNQGIGSDLADLLPTQSCGLISLYTDTLGKTGQGRVYVPFPSIDSIDLNGTPDNLYLVDLDVLAQSLIAPHIVPGGGVTATFTPVLYIPGGEPPKPIIRYIVRDAFATQRRRGAFGRLNASPF
jgi:hypothetical protein